MEYLVQGKDKQGRRHLVYTGKKFAPIIADMRNFDKSILKQERDNYLRDLTYCQKELELAQISIKTLDKENSELRLKFLLQTETRLMQIENLLPPKALPKSRLML